MTANGSSASSTSATVSEFGTLLAPPRRMQEQKYIRWLNDIHMNDVPLVGGKTASLGEMVGALVPKGIRIPNGFAVTVAGYRALLEQSGLRDKMAELLE